MEVKNWERIEGIFHAALPLDARARAAHLDDMCAGDEALRADVESLLTAFERRAGFLEDAAFSFGLKVLSNGAAESLVGEELGPYKIISQLGRGGMGEVYLAEDTRLGRKVALKFLSARLADDKWAKRQLVKEARAVAMVEHPNICAIHGMEEAGGHSFIVMQFVSGETLADLIQTTPPDVEQALALATQIVGAVAEAHAHGIIHRDLKPQNVMVGAGGQAKVLDFGLAKIVQHKHGASQPSGDSNKVSQDGLVIGTIAYMSPEQLRAERLDFRSDIFSLGTLLYELFSGKKPFARESDAEVIAAILTAPPAPLAEGIPLELKRIIFKCLEKDRDKRYRAAGDLLYDIENIGRGTRILRRHRALTATAIFALLLLLVVVSAVAYHRFTRPASVAVLPFANESGDRSFEYLGDGLAETLIARLSRHSGLSVRPFTAVYGYKGTTRAPLEVGRALGVDAVLIGEIEREGDALVLKTDLLDVSSGSHLWGERYRYVDTAIVSDLQREIAGSVVKGLGLRWGGNELKLFAHGDTENRDAMLEYFRGKFLWRNRSKENIQKAVEKFRAAIELDPSFARAHAGLADCYVLMNSPAYGNMPTEEAMNRARASARQALEIDDSLSEAHTTLGVVSLKYDWDWVEAEKRFTRAVGLDPGYAPAHYWYSNLLTITGRQDEAVNESALARKFDPDSPVMRTNFCREFYYGRQYDRAVACLNELLAENPGNVSAQRALGFVYLQKGLNVEAVKIFENIPETNRELKVVALGYAYARNGQRPEALRILAEVREMSRTNYIPPHEMAVLYLGLDDKDSALDWLSKACDERSAAVIYLTVDPAFDSLRSDPRFGELARRLQLPLSPASVN